MWKYEKLPVSTGSYSVGIIEERFTSSLRTVWTIKWVLRQESSPRYTGFRYDFRGTPDGILNSTVPQRFAYITVVYSVAFNRFLAVISSSVNRRKTTSDSRVFPADPTPVRPPGRAHGPVVPTKCNWNFIQTERRHGLLPASRFSE